MVTFNLLTSGGLKCATSLSDYWRASSAWPCSRSLRSNPMLKVAPGWGPAHRPQAIAHREHTRKAAPVVPAKRSGMWPPTACLTAADHPRKNSKRNRDSTPAHLEHRRVITFKAARKKTAGGFSRYPKAGHEKVDLDRNCHHVFAFSSSAFAQPVDLNLSCAEWCIRRCENAGQYARTGCVFQCPGNCELAR